MTAALAIGGPGAGPGPGSGPAARATRWLGGGALSLAAHGAVLALVLLNVHPRPLPPQPLPPTRVDITAYKVQHSDAAPEPATGPQAEAQSAAGTSLGGAAIAQSRAEPLPAPGATLAAQPPATPVAAARPPAETVTRARPGPGQTLAATAPTAPLTRPEAPAAPALAAAAPAGTPAPALRPDAPVATATALPATPPLQAAAAATPVAQATPPQAPVAAAIAPDTRPQPAAAAPDTVALAAAAAGPATVALAAAPPGAAAVALTAAAPPPGATAPTPAVLPAAPVTTATARSDAPAVAPIAPPAVAAAPAPLPPAPPAAAAPASGASLAAAAPAAPAAAALPPPSEHATAALAWAGGGGAVDPVSLAAIQAFMTPGDLAASSANAGELRDGVSALLAAVPCARLQTVFVPETGTLELRGHVPDPGLRAPLLAALQQKMGASIPVADKLRILPRPQCGALAGIAAVGLPQSTEQESDPRVIGPGAYVRDYSYTAGQRLTFELQAPDYPSVVYVDYFDAAGNVIHLQPNATVPLPRAVPKARLTVGKPAPDRPALNITIGPPYGQEIAVAFAASAPLYDGLRPMVEPAAPYLAFLRGKVAAARAADPAFKGEWVYFFISTAAR